MRVTGARDRAATLLDGRYALDEQIGAGGYCEVWRATDAVLTRPVAVKLLHAGYACQPEAQTRFKAEALHAGALSHKNIARVYDYGEPARGQPYLVMELIDGPSLATVLAGGPLDAVLTMEIVAQIAAGLQSAHSAGLIHRGAVGVVGLAALGCSLTLTVTGYRHRRGQARLRPKPLVPVMVTARYPARERAFCPVPGPPRSPSPARGQHLPTPR